MSLSDRPRLRKHVERLAGLALDSLSDEQLKKATAVLAMEQRKREAGEAVPVTVVNFVEAETARMFDGVLSLCGAINTWQHGREPFALDNQTVIRLNRDTLYSSAIVDITKGATVTLPDAGDRYMSLMVLNEGHYINAIYHGEGSYELTVDEFDSDYVCVAVRTFVDPNNPKDLEAVHELQDALSIDALSAQPYEHPYFDEETRKRTHELLLELGDGFPDARGAFGRADEVDPIRHLTTTAAGWGGLPEYEAMYFARTEPQEAGQFTLTVKDVPFDGFWSVSIYNRDGFFEENEYDSYSANNVTAVPNDDGSVTLNLSPMDEGLPNHLYIMDGWNYVLRVYRPGEEVVNGTWTPPAPVPAT